MQNDKLLPCPFCGGEAETTFICDGRYLFSQKSLENTILPETFNKYIKKLD